ncbi:MAG: hypothetical protein PHC78_12740 [Verrucomicrobiota bacterium]|nr:hypothetical protein [Verrucomicrobiota bacterium]
MKRRPYYLMPGVIACLVMTLALVVQAQTYDLTVTDDGQKVSLKADNASSYAIIQDLAKRLDIETRLAADADHPVTLDLKNVSPAEAVRKLSDSFGMTYRLDPETNEIRIVSIYTGSAGNRSAKELTTRELVESIQKKVSKITRYKSNMTMSMSMLGQNIKMDGVVMVKDPQHARMEFNMPGGLGKQVTIVDGDTSYSFSSLMPMVQKIDTKRLRETLGPELGAQMGSGGGNSFRLDDPFSGYDLDAVDFTGTKDADGRSHHVFSMGLPDGFEAMSEINPMMGAIQGGEVWFDTETGIPVRNTMLDASGKPVMDIRMTNTNTNPTDEDFEGVSFAPPADANIIDMTDNIIQMMKTMNQ